MKRSAIVTGAAGGIGKSIAEALSQEGYDVIVAYKDEINGLSVSEAIGGVFIRVDLTDRDPPALDRGSGRGIGGD